MKKIILLALLFVLAHNIKAQITLDVVYPNAKQKLYMVNLEVSGMKYVVKSEDPGNRFLNFYNLNHSLWKTINCNTFPMMTSTNFTTTTPLYNFDAICISEKVFDCDNNIEFMYVSQGPTAWFTAIYNETAAALLIADSMGPFVKINIPNQYKPIYNTPVGTKLILSHWNGSARVYNLPCALTTGLDLDNTLRNSTTEASMNVFPNPSFYESTINYHLPQGVNSAEIIINDISGKEIKRYKVDNNFSSLLIEQSEMAAGTYIYSLTANGKVIDSKKIVLSAK